MKKNTLKVYFGIFFLILFGIQETVAQLDTTHYMPPFVGAAYDGGSNFRDEEIILSTSSVTNITVTVTSGNGTPIAGSPFTINNSNPVVIAFDDGDNNENSPLSIPRSDLANKTNSGLIMTSSDLFYAEYRHLSSAQGSSVSAKGSNAIGKHFKWHTVSSLHDANIAHNYISIFAVEDADITISGLPSGLELTDQNVPNSGIITKSLLEGQSIIFEVKGSNNITNQQGMIGADIISTGNIVINTGGQSLRGVDDGTSGRDHGMDQIVPIEKVGLRYVVVRGNGGSDEKVTITATVDNTDIYLKGQNSPYNSTPLNEGDFIEIPGNVFTGGSLFIDATQPVYVYHLIVGANNNTASTQGLVFIPPLNKFAASEVSPIPFVGQVNGTNANDSEINIVAFAGEDVEVTIGAGSPTVLSGANSVTGTSEWVYYTINNVSEGSNYTISSVTPIQVSTLSADGNVGLSSYHSGFGDVPAIAVVGGADCGDELTISDGIWDLYQWYLNGEIISGANSQTYTVTEQGLYSAIVSRSVAPAITEETNGVFVEEDALTDNDSDGVSDFCDLDDDNDGILDTEEGIGTITCSATTTTAGTVADDGGGNGVDNPNRIVDGNVASVATLNRSGEYIVLNLGSVFNEGTEITFDWSTNSASNIEIRIASLNDGTFISGGGYNSLRPTISNGNNSDNFVYTTTSNTQYIQIEITNRDGGRIEMEEATITNTCLRGADRDSDTDGIIDALDLDSDNDGIPDNVESQTTVGYIAPNNDNAATYITNNGVNSAYSVGLTPINTDGIDDADYLDLDSDNDILFDIVESGSGLTDGNMDGRTDSVVGNNGLDNLIDTADTYADVNGVINDPATDFPDDDGDVLIGGDVDYRDNTTGIDTDGDGIIDTVDLDDDNDGILDTVENDTAVVSSVPTSSGVNDTTLIHDGDSTTQDQGANFNSLSDHIVVDLGSTIDAGTEVYFYLWKSNTNNKELTISEVPSATFVPAGGSNQVIIDESVVSFGAPSLHTYVLSAATQFIQIEMTVDSGGRIEIIEMEYQVFTSSDSDGIPDSLDIDSDNDGIPDNVEAQTTTGYIVPNADTIATYISNSGVNSAYLGGLTPVNTDGTDNVDYLDADSENDGKPDIQENGDTDNTASGTDTDGDGLDDNFDTVDTTGIAFDVNDNINNPVTDLPDGNNNAGSGGDVDYREGLDTDNDGVVNTIDLDDDNDGILDTIENGTAVVSSVPTSSGVNDTGFINDGDRTTQDQGANFNSNNDHIVVDLGSTINAGTEVYLYLWRSNSNNKKITISEVPSATFVSSGGGGANQVEIDENVVSSGTPSLHIYTLSAATQFIQIEMTANGGGRLELIEMEYQVFTSSDTDGIINSLDLDSDDDGIPDNVEAQTTSGYTAPNSDSAATYIANNGVNSAYLGGLTPVNTDGADNVDYLDDDSENDGTPDIEENGDTDNVISGTDTDGDGLDDNFDTVDTTGTAFDVNDNINNPSTDLPDANNNVGSGGDVDYREGLDTDNDGVLDIVDLDDDNDGILDTDEKSPLLGIFPSDLGLNANDSNVSVSNVDVSSIYGLPAGSILVSGQNIYISNAGNFVYDATNVASTKFQITGTQDFFLEIRHGNRIEGSSTVTYTINSGQNFSLTPNLVAGLQETSSGTILSVTNITTSEVINTSGNIAWVSIPDGTNFDFEATTTEPTGISNLNMSLCFSIDSDNDGIIDSLDIDSDNDGIPDNIEAQTTVGYIAPNNDDIATYIANNGVNSAYLGGLTPVNTDGTDELDYLDSDSDNDLIPDIEENGDIDNAVSGTDTDGDGLDDNFDDVDTTGTAFDVNDDINDPATDLPDVDGDVLTGGDVDYREFNSDVIITQVYENSGNKVIELTNLGTSTIAGNTINIALFSNTSGDQSGIVPTATYTVVTSLTSNQTVLIETAGLSGVNINNSPVREITSGVTNFDGGNDILILSFTTDNTAWANRFDVIESSLNTTSYVRNDDITTGKNVYTASEWTAFVDDNLDPYRVIGSGGPERHPHDPLISEITGSSANKNQGLGYHRTGATIRTGAAWTNGEPDRSRSIIISEDYAHTGSSLAMKILTLNTNSKLSITDNLLIVTDQITLTNTADEIRLIGTSQLVSTHISGSLVTGNGKLYVDQNSEVPSTYRFNYFGSPVNSQGQTTFTVADVFKDGSTPTSATSTTKDINFIGGFDGATTDPISIAEHWIYGFGVEADWTQKLSGGIIPQTDGVIFKGPGQVQNYTFVGTPKDGTMQTTVAADTDYLVGNPYASAISVQRFLEDNLSSTTGALYFWEQKESVNGDIDQNSHNFDGYVGGYAIRNISMGLAANNPLNTENDNLGIAGLGSGPYREPGAYIPLGQGFFIEGSVTGGTVEFNNSQREFILEGANSIFFRSGDNTSAFTENDVNTESTSSNNLPIIKLGMDYINQDNLDLHRQIGISFLQSNSFAFDVGYDATVYEAGITDFYWDFEVDDEAYAIAGVQEITENLEVPLTINMGYTGSIRIRIDEWANINRNVYLVDTIDNISYLISDTPADIFLNAGTYTDRFVIAFRINGTLSTEEVLASQFYIYTENASQDIMIVNADEVQIENVQLYDVLGKQIQAWNITLQHKEGNKLRLKTNKISSGIYYMKLTSIEGVTEKKIYLGF